MKILVSSAFNDYCHNGPPFSELAKVSIPVIKEYCESNNYDYFVKNLTKEEESIRNASWWKLVNVQERLKNYDWAWSIDIDGLIMNHNIQLENIVDRNYDMMIASHDGTIQTVNGGSILYKNSEWTNLFLAKMLDCEEFKTKGYWEQSTLVKFLEENVMDCKNRIKIVNCRLINSFYHYWFEKQNFQLGDLYCHLVGTDNDYRYDTMLKLRDFIIKKDNYIQKQVKIWDK